MSDNLASFVVAAIYSF